MTVFKSVRKTIKQRSRVIHGYSNALVSLALNTKQRTKRRFIIVSGGRRGSHLLADLLNSHKDFHVDGAVLNVETVPKMTWPRLYLLGRERSRQQQTYGFKAALNQLERQNLNPELFLQEFTQAGGKIIHLYRTNVLRSVVSREIAHTRGRHHDTVANPLSGQMFHIDCRNLASKLEDKISQRKTEAAVLRNLDHISINYESDLLCPSHHQTTCDRIFQYLGCSSQRVTTSLTKRSPPDLREVISNYDEVASVVEQAKLSHLLIDEIIPPMSATAA